MKKLFYFFVFFAISNNLQSQINFGDYTGYELEYIRRQNIWAIDEYTDKILTINQDSSFSFSFGKMYYHSAIGYQKRRCTGNWIIKSDTILLNSKYKMSDYMQVEERQLLNIENNNVEIVLNLPTDSVAPYIWVSAVYVKINSKYQNECVRFDTLTCAIDTVREIILSSESPYAMEWVYKPKNQNSNFFLFRLKTRVGGENICLENSKLLIRNRELIVLDPGALTVDERNYRCKK